LAPGSLTSLIEGSQLITQFLRRNKTQLLGSARLIPTRELFYGTLDGQIMVAAFTVEGDSFRAEPPRLWSDARYTMRHPARMFDLHPDGERFALAPDAQTPGGVKQDKVVFIFNLRVSPTPIIEFLGATS
jgi:hypothetical protein